MGHVLDLFLSIFDFMHFMARHGFDTSITDIPEATFASTLFEIFEVTCGDCHWQSIIASVWA